MHFLKTNEISSNQNERASARRNGDPSVKITISLRRHDDPEMFPFLSRMIFPATEKDDATDTNVHLNATWNTETFLLFVFHANVNLIKCKTVCVVFCLSFTNKQMLAMSLPCGSR